MAASDVKILEARLLTRDSAITGSTVTKCALRLQQLYAALQAPQGEESGDSVNSAREAFNRDILLYKIEMGKFEQSYNMLSQEAVEYDTLEATISSKIEETSNSIVKLTEELAQQKKLKKHREECEALSRLVNSVPCTRVMLASIKEVNDEMSRLKEQMASTEATERLRSRQVNLLLQSIADISQSLEEEDALQKQLQLLQQTVDNQTQDDDEVNEEDDDIDAEDESRDKRSERTTVKRKKPSGEDGDEIAETDVVEEGEIQDPGEIEQVNKKQKISTEDNVEQSDNNDVRSKGSGNDALSVKLSSPTGMTVKEKLLQQQEKRALKKLEKEKEMLRDKEKLQISGETEEGEEQEDEMDTTN